MMQFAQGQTEKLTKAKIQLKATNSQAVVLIRQSSPVRGLKLGPKFSETLDGSLKSRERSREGGQLRLPEHLATCTVLLLASLMSLKHFSQNKFSKPMKTKDFPLAL